jgi:hypothetical protein
MNREALRKALEIPIVFAFSAMIFLAFVSFLSRKDDKIRLLPNDLVVLMLVKHY